MTGRLAIVIAVDGLRAAALGAYGNAWHATPALDALAGESVVVDWMWCESPELATFYDAAWGAGALPKSLGAGGAAATLVTDDGKIAAWGDAAGFGDVLRLETEATASCDDVAETGFAGLLAVAAEKLAGKIAGSDSLLWIHACGFQGPWDAPLALRAGLLDDDDPEAPTFVEPPRLVETADQDALLGYQAAYAAQVIALDGCVAGFLAAVSEAGLDERALVVLVGSGGFALGEHGVVGGEDRRLYGERLHVPCLLRAPGMAPAPPRRSGVATPRDLYATLATWFARGAGEVSAGDDAVDLLSNGAESRSVVVARGENGELAMRTQGWMLRRTAAVGFAVGHSAAGAGAGDGVELYVKPDDRWEANEVAALCRDEVERLLAMLPTSDARSAIPSELPPGRV